MAEFLKQCLQALEPGNASSQVGSQVFFLDSVPNILRYEHLTAKKRAGRSNQARAQNADFSAVRFSGFDFEQELAAGMLDRKPFHSVSARGHDPGSDGTGQNACRSDCHSPQYSDRCMAIVWDKSARG